MTRRWQRTQQRASSGWNGIGRYKLGELIEAWSEPFGIDGNSDLRPEPQLTFCIRCGAITTYSDGTRCFDALVGGGAP